MRSCMRSACWESSSALPGSSCCWWDPDRGGKAAEWAPEFLRCAGNARGMACVIPFTSTVPPLGAVQKEASHVEANGDHVPCRRRIVFDGDGRYGAVTTVAENNA